MRRSAGNFRKQISVNKNGAKPSPAGQLVLLQFSGNGCLMGGSVRAGYPGRRTVARSKSLFNPGRGTAARARLVIARTSALAVLTIMFLRLPPLSAGPALISGDELELSDTAQFRLLR